MSDASDIPRLGDIVYYYDDDKRAHAAIVAFVHPTFSRSCERPIVNLFIIKHDGRIRNQTEVEPAYEGAKGWRVIEKWSWPDAVPEDEYSAEPHPAMRFNSVGHMPIPTT